MADTRQACPQVLPVDVATCVREDKSDHGRPPRPPHPVLPGAPPKPHPGGIPGHQRHHAHRSRGDSQQVKCESLSFNTCSLQNHHAGTLPRPTEKQRAVCPALAFLQRRQRHPTPVLLPGESQGRGSLVGLQSMGSLRVRHD